MELRAIVLPIKGTFVCQTAESMTLPRVNPGFGTNDLSVFQTPLTAKVPGPLFGPGMATQRPTAEKSKGGVENEQ